MQKADISEEEKEIIMKFVNSKTAEAGISQNRANKFTRMLGSSPRYADLTHDEVVRIVAEIERSDLKEWTKREGETTRR